MKKSARKSLLLDRLHKGFVLTCIGVSLFGLSHLGYRWYRYFTVLRPDAKRKELMEKEQLLAEGSSDLLKDKAINLTT